VSGLFDMLQFVWQAFSYFKSPPAGADLSLALDYPHERDLAHKARKESTWNATDDALTDIPNRLLLMDRLTRTIAADCRRDHKVAALLVAFDGPKEPNGRLGHNKGDEFPRMLAQRFQSWLRDFNTRRGWAATKWYCSRMRLTPNQYRSEVENSDC